MARRRSVAAQAAPDDVEQRQVIAWYEDQLERAAPPTGLAWEPVKIGPTWQYENGWVLPECTLGWRNLGWSGTYLSAPKGGPWRYTLEQARFILWQDAIDPESGEFLFPFGVLQRLKGWGKDPLAVALSTTDICSEHAVFSHFDAAGQPVGQEMPNAYVQIVGVAQDQIKRNTMPLYHALIPVETRKKYGIQIGKLDVWAKGDTVHIEAPASSTLALEGPRPTRVIRNETQNWVESNGGHALAGAIEGNLAKSEDGRARSLDICNAYVPGRGSVAEKTREGYEQTLLEDGIETYGLLYDSLEAPPNAPLTLTDAPSVIESIRGDSVWLNTKRILNSIKNPNNSPSESRRKWYNQITGTEDAWIEPRWADGAELLGKGLDLEPGDRIALFGDGSKSRDDTGLIAVRLSDGLTKVLWFFHPTDGQIVDRDGLDTAVEQAFETYKVVAFWFDPSHAKDDSATGEDDRFWWPLVDRWHTRYSKRLDKKFWAVKSGDRTHAIAFDMLKPGPQQLFQPAVSQVRDDLENGRIPLVASKRLVQHMKNARQREARYGISIGKENRSSSRKIDLAVCLVGAQMLRRLINLKKSPTTGRRGRVIALG